MIHDDSEPPSSPFGLSSVPLRCRLRKHCKFSSPTMTAGQRHDRSALILYGSETGNALDVAEELGSITERLNFLTHVSKLDAVEPVRGTEWISITETDRR